MTRALADSYRAKLVRAARRDVAFDPVTGEPAARAAAEAVTVIWYQHAEAYAEMKWPGLAPHSRASLADALATVTPLLTRETGCRPPGSTLRAALYGHAFNPRQRRSRALDPVTATALAWLEGASMPVSQLSDPQVIRVALDGLCTRLDGTPAAANTIARKRAVFHGTLGYAVELGLLSANPISQVQWRAPRAAVAIHPVTVASLAQVRAILAQVCRIRPDLAAFFGCLYYAALRPEEAVALRRGDLVLPAHGRGKLILTAACPRTGSAWTGTGTPHEPRSLKHGPDLAATALARRPYDLRQAALSLWLNASAEPAKVATRAGNSTRVLHEVYLHCIDSRQDLVSQRIEDALDADPGSRPPSPCGKASGYTHRRHHPGPCPLYVRRSPRRPARSSRTSPAAD